MRNFPELIRKHLCWNLIFDKVKLSRSATSFKTSLQCRFFSCEVCGICWNTFFKEHHRTTACDYSSINSSEWRIGKRNCELRYKNYSMCTNLSRKCKLLKKAVQMKEQVSEVVADFKLKNFVNPQENICVGVSF